MTRIRAILKLLRVLDDALEDGSLSTEEAALIISTLLSIFRPQ